MNPLNNGTITGGLTADPEIRGEKVARLRLAVDYAGRDQGGGDNRDGYFDVTYFLNDDTPNGKFVTSQIRDGKMKKGSKVSIVYSLEHQRWSTDGQNRSAVVLIAHAITYTPTSRPREDGATGGGNGQANTAAPQAAAAPIDF